MTASSHGENDPRRGDCFGGNNTKDLCVAIFCNIMIMYSLRNDNDNYPGPDMDKAYIPFYWTLNVKNSKE